MITFESSICFDGINIQLSKKQRRIFQKKSIPLSIENWFSDGNIEVRRGLVALTDLLQDEENISKDHIVIPFETAANFTESEANALNLPETIPFQLRIWSKGTLLDNSYDIQCEFLDNGEYVFLDSRTGCIQNQGRIQYRIPSPMFEVIELIKFFPEEKDKKLETISKISEILQLDTSHGDKFEPEDALANIKLRHVSGFSSSIKGSLDNPELTPVLFSKHLIEGKRDNDEILDEIQQILTPEQAEYFTSDFLKDVTNRTYVLNTGEYVYIDPSIREILEAFRKIAISDSETKRNFIKSPRAMLRNHIPDDENLNELLNSAFVETNQFSERVIEINQWVTPDLPFLVTERNDWGTDVLIFEQVGSNTPIIIPKDKLGEVHSGLKIAHEAGESTINCDGRQIPVNKEIIGQIENHLPQRPENGKDIKKIPEDETVKRPFVVKTLDNFEAINYSKKKTTPNFQLSNEAPRTLLSSTRLLDHQTQGLEWLIAAYNKGYPGVLIADDMGLGKTLQALVFLALYQQQTGVQSKKPSLIVAPTGLLKNWLKEVTTHLGDGGLGNIQGVYGSEIKKLRTNSGRDIDSGSPSLNINKLSKADVVLTTYESLRDYQISFAQVDFGVVVFDEIQKTKNPKSLLSRSAATLNGSFQIGLSGTPVENSLADLWTIMDVLAPGLLDFDLKEFLNLFSGDPEDPEVTLGLERLHRQLLAPNDGEIAPILRRMKKEVFKNKGPDGKPMPKKFIKPAEETLQTMPSDQAIKYSSVSNKVQSGKIKMIEALQSFKKISLSSKNTDLWLDDFDRTINDSARLKESFRILDEIYLKKEKVLIFIESRAVQPLMATIIKERYKLKKLPLIINGAISGDARQKNVDDFQSGEKDEFNAIIISPKAGGVGLTLTAANHVIHIERWWNPAVEDQCNDRAYRIGATKDVHIYTPVARHPQLKEKSFDLVLDKILQRKRALANSLFVPTELKAEDFSIMFGQNDKTTKFQPISLEESYELETGEDFENYVAASLQNAGFKIRMTPRSHDGGCDLIAEINDKNIICQIKQVRSKKTLSHGVDEIISAKSRFSKANMMCLITNSLRITSSQRKLAREKSVILILGESIEEIGNTLYRDIS